MKTELSNRRSVSLLEGDYCIPDPYHSGPIPRGSHTGQSDQTLDMGQCLDGSGDQPRQTKQ